MRNPSAKLVLLADLGRLRAFRFLPDEDNPFRTYAIEEIVPDHGDGEGEPLEEPKPIHTQVTDQAGRFPARGAGTVVGGYSGTEDGMAIGDYKLHTYEREEERKNIQQLAQKINATVEREGLESWNLAAPQPLLESLLSALDKDVRERLTSTEGRDYTKLPIKKVEEIFAVLR